MAPAKSWLWRYSVRVCRRPRLVIGICLVVTLVCSLGLFRVEIITNPDLIWVPPNSLANRQKEFFDDAFSPFFRINQVFFIAEAVDDGRTGRTDMIQKQYLQRVMSVQRAIESATFTSSVDGKDASFESLCYKPIEGEGCLVESPSQYWLDDPVLLAGDAVPSLTAACQTADAFLASRSPCMDEIGTPVMREVVFGDIGTNSEVESPDPCGGSVPSAGALVLTFLLNNYRDPDYQKLAEQWEQEVFLSVVQEARSLLQNDVQAPMKVSFMAQRSVADSLSVEAGENAWVLVVSYLCMFLYVSLILGDPCHAIRSRYSLALTGITIVIASLSTTIGLLSLAGIGTTLIVWEVVPFLTLAIGVDNMVILSREFDRLEAAPEFEPNASTLYEHHRKGVGDSGRCMGPTYAWAGSGAGSLGGGRGGAAEACLEERMGAAVAKVAPSILGAAVCEAGAFFVGALTDIPALRQFCFVAGTAVAVGFLLQVTWFVAALSLDARRVSQGRLDLAPWVTPRASVMRAPLWPPPPGEFDTLDRSGSRGLNVPLLQGERSPRHQSLPSLYRPTASAVTAAGDGGDYAFDADAESRYPRGYRDDGRGRERSFTSEIGAGSDANPALFPKYSEAARGDGGGGAAGRHRRRDTGRDRGGFQATPIIPAGSGNAREGANRRWFDDPQAYDDSDLSVHDNNGGDPGKILLWRNSSGSASPILGRAGGNGRGRTGPPHGVVREGNGGGGGGRPATGSFVLGGDVVEGYVSLAGGVDRRGSGDDSKAGGGLLVAGPPPDDVETKERLGGGGGDRGGGLALFREQLYEEGRCKGNLASRLLDRYYLPALFSRGGKTLTLVVAAGLAVLGGFGLAGLRMGLEPQLAAPTDFYLQDYYNAQFSLGEAGPPAYIVFSDVDYFKAFSDSDAKESFRGVSTGLAQLQRYVQAPIYSWFDTVVAWVNQKGVLAADCPTQIDVTDEASFYSMVKLFLTIPIESQCCQSYGVCGAQFATDVVFDDGGEDGIERIRASRLRFNLQPLSTQRDYVNSYYYIKLVTNQLAGKISERYKGQRKANKDIGNLAFPYSLYFVFYEQYGFIQGVALQNIALALAVVFLSLAVLSGFPVAWMVTSLVLCTTLGTVGLVWAWGELSRAPYGVSINAVSVCNIVMSLGLSMEFCLHVALAFMRVRGTRQERAEAAMKSAGASVLTGITLTKFVGVSVLAIAPSLLFRVYYFRMYMATVIAGAFQGLAVLPVLLSIFGPSSPPTGLPKPSSWPDAWLDKHDALGRRFSSGGVCEDSSVGGSGGFSYEVGGGMPGGALGWDLARGDVDEWDSWGDEEEDDEEGEGSGGSGRGLALPPTSHLLPGDSVVQ